MAVQMYARGDYIISTDKSKLDIGMLHDYLSRLSYWAEGRPYDLVQRSLDHSLCFGVYLGSEQVGFARVVTDFAAFGWLEDVFILEPYRGQGLGKWLVETVVSHPDLRELRVMLLATRDAHGLYRRYGGFGALDKADEWMIRRGESAGEL